MTVDKQHAGQKFSSYLWIDESGTLMETPIIYENDKVEMGKTVWGLGLSDPYTLPLNNPAPLPDEFLSIFDKLGDYNIQGIR